MSDSKSAPRFNPFPDLPFEIRSVIWDFCLPQPRTFDLIFDPDYEPFFTSQNPQTPTLLGINQESRAHLLRTYKYIRTVNPPIFFNPSKDTIFMNNGHNYVQAFNYLPSPEYLAFEGDVKIRKLAISEYTLLEAFSGPDPNGTALRRLILAHVYEVFILLAPEWQGKNTPVWHASSNEKTFIRTFTLGTDYPELGWGETEEHYLFKKSLEEDLVVLEKSGKNMEEFTMPVISIMQHVRLTMVDPFCRAPVRKEEIPTAQQPTQVIRKEKKKRTCKQM